MDSGRDQGQYYWGAVQRVTLGLTTAKAIQRLPIDSLIQHIVEKKPPPGQIIGTRQDIVRGTGGGGFSPGQVSKPPARIGPSARGATDQNIKTIPGELPPLQNKFDIPVRGERRTLDLTGVGVGKNDLELTINPSKNDILRMLKNVATDAPHDPGKIPGMLRYSIDVDTRELHVWDAMKGTHGDVSQKINLPAFGRETGYIEKDARGELRVFNGFTIGTNQSESIETIIPKREKTIGETFLETPISRRSVIKGAGQVAAAVATKGTTIGKMLDAATGVSAPTKAARKIGRISGSAAAVWRFMNRTPDEFKPGAGGFSPEYAKELGRLSREYSDERGPALGRDDASREYGVQVRGIIESVADVDLDMIQGHELIMEHMRGTELDDLVPIAKYMAENDTAEIPDKLKRRTAKPENQIVEPLREVAHSAETLNDLKGIAKEGLRAGTSIEDRGANRYATGTFRMIFEGDAGGLGQQVSRAFDPENSFTQINKNLPIEDLRIIEVDVANLPDPPSSDARFEKATGDIIKRLEDIFLGSDSKTDEFWKRAYGSDIPKVKALVRQLERVSDAHFEEEPDIHTGNYKVKLNKIFGSSVRIVPKKE
jgi:hypothetical protein